MTSWLGADGLQGLYPNLETAPTVLGWDPLCIEPTFTRGQDWNITLTPATTGNPWPGGATITAYVYSARTDTSKPISTWTLEFAWNGAINPTTGDVTIKAAYTDTDLIEDFAILRIMVVLPDTPTPDTYCWARGRVRRDD